MFKFELKEYRPFEEINNFYILKDNLKNVEYFIFSKNNINYSLEIMKDGYIPKSGLIFDEIIEKNVKNKSVLDLGTGQLGFLALHSWANGAKKITAVDVDEKCIKWLNYLIKTNKLTNIETKISDYYSEIEKNRTFDIILANPPQMPMQTENYHDSGGFDGRKYILKILKDSKKHFNKNSQLYMLIFDFLGIDNNTNNNKNIFQIATEYGYKNIKILKKFKKIIKRNSVTFQNINHIKNVYPKYIFNENDRGEKYCYIDIVLFE